MKTQLLKPNVSAVIGLVLAFPAAYFFFINILNEIGMSGLYDASEPMLESLGIQEGLGLNLNLLILLGPVLALLFNVTSILRIEWRNTKTEFDVHVQIEKRWINWIVAGLSGLCLAILFLYLFVENCR